MEKATASAALLLCSGSVVQGSFFVAGYSAVYAGPERIKDVLTGESAFFPFEVRGTDGRPRTILYNRDHVIHVALGNNHEARLDPGYAVATQRTVSMLLSNGARLVGAIRVYRPKGRDRLSDFARAPEAFSYLETSGCTYLVNVRHVVELAEEPKS